MNRFILIAAFNMLLLVGCQERKPNTPTSAFANSLNFNNQLFLFQENGDPELLVSGKFATTGSMYLTAKGNIIYYTVNQESDTQSFFYGKYRVTDSTVSFILTDKYYYHGKWDASWSGSNPDFKKGQAMKVQFDEITLNRIEGDSSRLFRAYSEVEKINASKRYINCKPEGLEFWTYIEPKEQKFYKWLYTQIPELADL